MGRRNGNQARLFYEFDLDEAYNEGRRIQHVRTSYDQRQAHDQQQLTFLTQQKQRLSEADLSTLQHHHDVNLMEIEMGKLAQQRGGPEVKKYAAALVKDHQTADKTAIAIAKARAVTVIPPSSAISPSRSRTPPTPS